MEEATTRAAGSRTRDVWFSLVSGFFAALFGVVLFGWVSLVVGWFESDDRLIHRVHDLGSNGVASGLLVATPLLILAWRRHDVALLQMPGVAAVAIAVAAVLATDWVYLAFVPFALIPLLILLAISKGWRRFGARGRGWAPELLLAAAAAAPFWGAFAWTMARFQANLPSIDPHVEEHHWTGMAGMAIGLILMVVLASTRTQGWRTVALLAGVGAVVYGAASIAFGSFPVSGVPYPSSEGTVWGVLAIAWGVAVVGLAERRARGPA
jgi:hypothetical protein